jgi:hypothetical protein
MPRPYNYGTVLSFQTLSGRNVLPIALFPNIFTGYYSGLAGAEMLLAGLVAIT